jgi:selenocysteine-specific elongation factor
VDQGGRVQRSSPQTGAAEGGGPLTVGTAGHVDHGKTALVKALTGVDTDRLAQEQTRGMSIELGYARLTLPSGRRLSIVDVPGHERFVATMVAGATGVDCHLMTIAADEGVRRQTREHARILRALGITAGVVAITKADLADPAPASAQARELFGAIPIVTCSAHTGGGLEQLLIALEDLVGRIVSRSTHDGPALMHIDRSFTVKGAGTVVTGTLCSGCIAVGDTLTLEPRAIVVRVRSIQVHGEAREAVQAGQRVAVNLARLPRAEVGRGDVLTQPATVEPAYLLDVELDFDLEMERSRLAPRQVHVHHGTRATAARMALLELPRLVQLRCRWPLLARAGERLVIRDTALRDTLGGAIVIDPVARRHRPVPASTDFVEDIREASEQHAGEEEPAPLTPADLALAQRLRVERFSPTPDTLGDHVEAEQMVRLRAARLAVRLVHGRHAHMDAVQEAAAHLRAVIAAEGQISLPRLRDELGVSRRDAKAFLDHFDQTGLTIRHRDDTRTLRRARGAGSGK